MNIKLANLLLSLRVIFLNNKIGASFRFCLCLHFFHMNVMHAKKGDINTF